MGSEPEPPPEEAGKGSHRSVRERTAGLRSRADDARRSLAEQSEALRARSATARLAFDAYDHDRRHAGALLAGGLAYRLFLWMLPTSLMVASAVGVIANLSSEPPLQVAERAGLGVALTTAIAQAAQESGQGALLLLPLGLWLMVWTGMSVVKALRLLSGVAYQLRPGPFRHGIRASLVFSGIVLALVATPVVLGPLYGGGLLLDALVWTATPVAWTPLFAWGFSTLPHPGEPGWITFMPGAALLAVGLSLLRFVTSVYFVGRMERTGDLYGAIGVAAVFMVWLFLIGRLVVAGITLNAAGAGNARAEAAPDS
jgi:uncharacterized BrkB/YihY/UPF0761 family membrane protein